MIALPLREWEVLAYMRENHAESPVRRSALPRKWYRSLDSLSEKTLLIKEQVVIGKGNRVTMYSAFENHHYQNVKMAEGWCDNKSKRKVCNV